MQTKRHAFAVLIRGDEWGKEGAIDLHSAGNIKQRSEELCIAFLPLLLCFCAVVPLCFGLVQASECGLNLEAQQSRTEFWVALHP